MRCVSSFSANCLYVRIIRNKATAKVIISDTGMEYSTPSRPKNRGRITANGRCGCIVKGFNYDREAYFLTAISDRNILAFAVITKGKRLAAFGERKMKSAVYLTINGVDRLVAVPVNVGADN